MKPLSLMGIILVMAAALPAYAQDDIIAPCEHFTLTLEEPADDAECVIWLKGVTEDRDHIVRIYGLDLRESDFAGMMLNELDLMGANLSDSNLSSAYLDGAMLADANLTNANLRGASLLNANLQGADLTDADLTGALLTCAILPNGEFATADDADFFGAIVQDFDCSQITE